MRKKDIKRGDLYWVNIAPDRESPECVKVQVLRYDADRRRWQCRRCDGAGELWCTTSKFRLSPDEAAVGSAVAGDRGVVLTLRVPEDLRDRLRAIPGWQDRAREVLADLAAG